MTNTCSEHLRPLCDAFMRGEVPRYIFGRTPYAASIAEYITPDGVIDDFTTEREFAGLPVVKMADVPQHAIVLSAIVDGRPVSVDRLLKSSGRQVIDYFSFKNYVDFPLKEGAFVSSAAFQDDYRNNREKYNRIAALLADDISRETFSRLVKFRLEEDLNLMSWFTFRPQESYFEPFVNLHTEKPVFVDVGSFDGETAREFIRRCPAYHRVDLFEPEPRQMAVIKEKLTNERDIYYHQCGASNKKETLTFTSSGSWSHLDDNGDIVINVDTIDSLVTEAPTFIKMDVEGHEYAALEGARQSIITHHPALAICCYHRVDDYWKLPELVFSFRSDYKLYLRHYTEGVLETVFYFIPV